MSDVAGVDATNRALLLDMFYRIAMWGFPMKRGVVVTRMASRVPETSA